MQWKTSFFFFFLNLPRDLHSEIDPTPEKKEGLDLSLRWCTVQELTLLGFIECCSVFITTDCYHQLNASKLKCLYILAFTEYLQTHHFMWLKFASQASILIKDVNSGCSRIVRCISAAVVHISLPLIVVFNNPTRGCSTAAWKWKTP